MDYKVVNRPKLPRNKYNQVEDKDVISGGNSYFSSTSSNIGSGGSGTEYKEFVGSTTTQDGKKGLVPAPRTNNNEPLIDNDNQKFLKGSGTWVDIPISRYTSENTNKDGINLNGNLTVSDTLTTNTLNVLGTAHFWELVIDKVKAAGGNLLITPASFKIDYVGDVVNYNVDETQSPFNVMFYNQNEGTGINGLKELFTANNVTQLKGKRLYMKNSDTNNQIVSEFEIGDMVRCKTLNLDENSGFTNKDYWTFILGTGVGTYNSESCMYIDVLYQYVANGTTYGLGTTISLPSSNNTRSLKSTKSVSATRTTSTTTPEINYNIPDLTQYQFNPYSKLYLAANPSWGNADITVSGSLSFSGYPDFDGVTWVIGNQTFVDGDSYTSIVNGHTLSISCYIDSRIDANYPVVCFYDADGVGLNNLMSGMGAFWVEQGASPGPTPTTVADPVISYSNNTITITCSTSGATIYYKLNSGSYTQYSSPITINENTTVQAYATKDNVNSNTVSETCTYVNPTPETVADPVISYSNNTITITCSTTGATIYYKLNSGSYSQYTSPIVISSTTTVYAYATKNSVNSNTVSQTCTYVAPTPETVANPVISFVNNTISITCVTSGAVIYYKLNNNSFVQYSTPIGISSTTTVYAYATKNGANSNTVSQVCTYVDPSPSNINEFRFGYGTFNPEVGDDLICLGHLWNAERQGAILISAYDPMDPELRAPAIAQYMGIRTFTTLSPYRVSSIAANGNTFMGRFLVNYNGNYVDIDEKLNIYTADITTGLERVGIHLDGENSTIKMVGSAEIRQNADGIVDTLTVWDSDDIMRVKISPELIPNKSNIQQDINPTSSLQFRNNDTINNYGITVHHTWTEFIWSWDHRWEYYITSGGYIKFTQYCNIGTFQAGDKITLNNLNTTLMSRAYFKGGDYINTRSATGRTQSITDVIIRLKRQNGNSYVNVDTVNLTNSSSIAVGNENATISYSSSIWNNYTISTAGSYRVELEFVYYPYASITYTSEQSNPYIDFFNNLSTTINIVQPSASMTRIGRNGIVFNTENSGQYFYAGADGIEMKWGDSKLTLSSSEGFMTNYSTTNITSNSTKYLQTKDSFVIATTISSNTTIYLPDTDTYGTGRVLTIIGNDYITLQTYNSSEMIYTARSTDTSSNSTPSQNSNPFSSSRTLSLSSTWTSHQTDGDGTYDVYNRSHLPIVRLLCSGSGWYLI